MREIVTGNTSEITPSAEDLYLSQAMPTGATIPEPVAGIAHSAIDRFQELARPMAVVDDISLDQFREIYPGDGHNDISTPLTEIYPLAEHIALFAGTVGDVLLAEITRLFDIGDLALAMMLDAAATEGAERFVNVLEDRFSDRFSPGSGRAVLAYSPGYCGWHLSGQRFCVHPRPASL